MPLPRSVTVPGFGFAEPTAAISPYAKLIVIRTVTAMIHRTALDPMAYITKRTGGLGSFGEQLPQSKMCEHHIGSPIERFIVRPFKTFTFYRWMEKDIDFMNEMRNVILSDVAAVIFEQLIDPNQHIGDGMKPCEPGIALKQFQQAVHRLNRTDDAFIGLLFGDDQRAVQPNEALSDREDCAPEGIDRNERSGLG